MADRVVFDCMVYLQAVARPHRASRCFEIVQSEKATLCLSREVLDEVHDVLARPSVREKFPALTDTGVRAFLESVLQGALWIRDVPRVASLPRDPKDEKYLDLAGAAGARYLVSWDKDLLSLMDADESSSVEFRAKFPALSVLTPSEFVRLAQFQ